MYGFAPYNTWVSCTFESANKLLLEADVKYAERIGVLRSYFTRHGAGPFPSEVPDLVSGEAYNKSHKFAGNFREGYFDEVLAKYARSVCGEMDGVAITHLDRYPKKVVPAYDDWDDKFEAESLFAASAVAVAAEDIVVEIERNVGLRVKYASYGPTERQKVCLR